MCTYLNCKILSKGVPIVPGTPGPIKTTEEAMDFCNKHGLPVIFKAAFGGGGRGMRVVRKMEVNKKYFPSVSTPPTTLFLDCYLSVCLSIQFWIRQGPNLTIILRKQGKLI